MDFLINDETNEVTIQVTEKHLAKIIKRIRKSTGLSKDLAKVYWKRKMAGVARKHHNAKTITFQLL